VPTGVQGPGSRQYGALGGPYRPDQASCASMRDRVRGASDCEGPLGCTSGKRYMTRQSRGRAGDWRVGELERSGRHIDAHGQLFAKAMPACLASKAGIRKPGRPLRGKQAGSHQESKRVSLKPIGRSVARHPTGTAPLW